MRPELRRAARAVVMVAVVIAFAAVAACSGDSGSAEELCARVDDDSQFERVLGDGLQLDDPDRAKEQLAGIDTQLRELRDSAPDELKDDLGVLIEAIGAISDAVDEGSDDALAAAQRELDEKRSEIESANAELETFRQTTCGTLTSTTTTAG